MSVIREVAANGAAIVILLGITLAAGIPLVAAAQTPPPAPDTRPALPSDAELESSGAVIGRIVLNIGNIFNEADPREDKALYRLANRLHIKTREDTVRSQLLFKTGDPYPRARARRDRARAARGGLFARCARATVRL